MKEWNRRLIHFYGKISFFILVKMAKKSGRFPFVFEILIGILLFIVVVWGLSRVNIFHSKTDSNFVIENEKTQISEELKTTATPTEDLRIPDFEIDMDALRAPQGDLNEESESANSGVESEPEIVSPPEVVEEILPEIIVIAPMSAQATVDEFFAAYNKKDFERACALMSRSKCDERMFGAVERFSQEFEKTVDGYKNVKVWAPSLPEGFHSDVVCVGYEYAYKNDSNPKKIQEILSFYLDEKEPGFWEIRSRVCERKMLNQKIEVPCPLQAIRPFCL